jgi:hypothetical protein
MQQRSLEQPVQALPAGIDDPGLAQDREQARRLRDGPFGGLRRRREDRLDVVVALGRLDRPGRRLADDGQDRPLDRLRHRAVGGLRPLAQRMGEIQAVEPLLASDRLRHAAEDLAGDDARVAARAHERPEADRGGDPVGGLTGDGLGLVERGPDRGEHVRPGVAVGDGIDVEAVDLVDMRLQVRDRRPERIEQPVPVASAAGHLGDVRPAVRQVPGSDAAEGQRGRSLREVAARRDVQAVDMDDDPGDIALERSTDRIADR